MKQILLAIGIVIALLLPPRAHADVGAVIDGHILPGHAGFAAATGDLATAAARDCTPDALRPTYQAAFDAWMGVSHLRLGPVEEEGRALAIAFWPDTRGLVPRTLGRLIAAQDPVVTDPAGFAEVSVAGRGLFALERLLFDPDFAGYGPGDYTCALTRAIATDLARMAARIDTEWRDGFADTLRNAGAPGNPVYHGEKEGAQALFTALVTGLEFTADQRLDRPLGTFDRPRPNRAEARRAGRPLRNITLSLTALRDLAMHLANDDAPQTAAAFDRALETAAALDDPLLAGVADPQGRLRVEILQQHVRAARDAARAEIGPRLGVSAGFNALDGD
ncbi:imelysin family protein [Rhodovulum adriaticum]|uniref:Imelysin-like domain-containing protein n=1 Tax=Rhodovulum adriaticum TaxID=35804 RepID=A0A4R2NKE7_RHOAD|nr:imelysin family protein [Rhodovulum adriaticum]MBK1635462.1 signal peptidase [Rhodovulum adriaticum]TCP22033.1 hypothetical protein EV656_10879 [Rhodovulum adriaticum]